MAEAGPAYSRVQRRCPIFARSALRVILAGTTSVPPAPTPSPRPSPGIVARHASQTGAGHPRHHCSGQHLATVGPASRRCTSHGLGRCRERAPPPTALSRSSAWAGRSSLLLVRRLLDLLWLDPSPDEKAWAPGCRRASRPLVAPLRKTRWASRAMSARSDQLSIAAAQTPNLERAPLTQRGSRRRLPEQLGRRHPYWSEQARGREAHRKVLVRLRPLALRARWLAIVSD